MTIGITSEDLQLKDALWKKLGPDGIETLVLVANRAGLRGRKADGAIEEALLKHARAIRNAAPTATIANVSTASLLNALSSELEQKDGVFHGL